MKKQNKSKGGGGANAWIVVDKVNTGKWTPVFPTIAKLRRHSLGLYQYIDNYKYLHKRGLARVVRCRIEVEEPEVKG